MAKLPKDLGRHLTCNGGCNASHSTRLERSRYAFRVPLSNLTLNLLLSAFAGV